MARIGVGDTVEFRPNGADGAAAVVGRVLRVFPEPKSPDWLHIQRLDEHWLSCFRFADEVRRVGPA